MDETQEVPLAKEMAEEVNVLVFGHVESGKSSIIGKVLELGGYLSEEQIGSYKNKSKDESEKSDWYLNYVKAAKKPKPKFARTFYQAGEKNFKFLEFQSDEDYFPKLMMKTKNPTVGVLVHSGVFHEKISNFEAIQTRKYFQFFRAICGSSESRFHGLSKLIVLINKNDARNFHSEAIKRQFTVYLKTYGFDTSKVEIISVSSRSSKDVLFFLSRLSALAASEDYCLRSELCGKTTDPIDSIFKHMWDNLFMIDIHLDANLSDKSLWHERAEILYQAGINLTNSLQAEEGSLEASRIIRMACKAAEKAKDETLEDKIKLYLLRVDSCINEARELVKKSPQIAKSCRKDQQKVEKSDAQEPQQETIVVEDKQEDLEEENKVEKSDAQKPEQETFVVEDKQGDLEEENKVEKSEGETSVVRGKQEDPEIPQKIVKISVKSSSTYSIDPEKRDTFYSGSRMISSRSSKKTFIPIELSELQNYDHMESLGSEHPNMLALHDITESVIGDTPLVLLVAEDVDTIDWFFNGMFQKFVEDHESSVELIRSEWSLEEKGTFMKSWWNLIAKDFHIIFGDVVIGLLYLYSLGMPSGGLRDHIYVSRDKRGRILPCMDKMKTYGDDIEDLVKIMKDVIYQPRLELGAKRESDYLPPELEHFLGFVKKAKLRSVSAMWLLDQPYFWCSPKRVNFMRKLQKCMQKPSIKHEYLNDAVARMMDKEYGPGTLWFKYLQDPVLKEIYNAGEEGSVTKYTANGHIVRFFNAVCNQANEKKSCRPTPIEDGVYEKIFRSHFPRIYTCLVNLIFNCARWNRFNDLTSSEAMEWFLSSSDI